MDSMKAMPMTRSLIKDAGTHFKNFVVCTSLCCPSRVGLLTGLMTHNHNVTGNGGM